MAELGLFALPFPQSVGGAGGDFLSYCLALEEIARADAAVAITLEAAVSLGISPIVSFGTAEQQERWLPDLLAGTRLWAFGLTEPEAGSDAGGTKTRAQPERRRVGHQRRQVLHHQRGHRDQRRGHHHRGHRHGRR